MDRRNFLKGAAAFTLTAVTFVLASQTAPARYVTKKIKNLSYQIFPEGESVRYTVTDPAKASLSFINLKFVGGAPKEFTLNVITKKGDVLVEGKPLNPEQGELEIQVIERENDEYIIQMNISPEMIIGDRVYVDVKQKESNPKYALEDIWIDVKEGTDPVVENEHDIEGYVPQLSYRAGEEIELKVHAPTGRFGIEFVRYGKEEKVVDRVENIKGIKQNYTRYVYRNGANWKTSYSYRVPDSWRTGLYGARLFDQSGKEFYISFNIKSSRYTGEKKKRIAVLSSTNTWTAYNTWGGASLYKYFVNDHVSPLYAQIVNSQRPNIEASPVGDPIHLANAEKLILSWLEENEYDFHVIADSDLHTDKDLLSHFGTLIINTHGEYWTEEMYNALEDFMNQGGNLLYLSGNGVYWKSVVKDNQLEVRKAFGYHVLNDERGGLWNRIGRSEAGLLGVRYTPTGFNTFHPYKVKQADHWIFDGTNLKNGDEIGKEGLNRGGASGHETDKRNEFSPKNLILLAKGTNPEDGGAEMVYYDHPGGGGVFSVGSVTFGGSLVVDDKLSQMVKNVMNRYTLESKSDLS
ncbi:twin-arginine translocation signal domain-containing protein [Hazenella sp. IB182353]|uniref:N,N-dimethylformamidase beta subunit family domain-containing protein n=1 Tax=Polycladospora coralii TaxID=2771432 RepID=UPI0017474AA1|nr:N,N-dimethylformamidase beta subunit family domain-containing protein [Polycladospora coralii]MBS7530686.1 twin-arginine translocation signal domain-containing protein [Polycladospora coralii]